MNTAVDIAGIEYKSPVFLASGTAGFGFEFAEILDISRLGGIVTKTITPLPRAGNPPPRIFETPCGMLNSIGLANPGLDGFLNDVVPNLENMPTDVIVSVGGSSIDEFIHLVEAVSALNFVSAIELNLSCPNVKKGGIHFGRDATVVEKLMRTLRKRTDKKLWAKLSPQVTDIVELALAACSGGADAIAVTNTLPAMAIDIWTRKSHLGAGTGGLSGSAIRPVAVALINTLFSKISVPIIGLGGISHPEDAVELILAGASAIQIGSGAFANPMLPIKAHEFLSEYSEKQGFDSVAEFVGAIRK